MHQDLKTMGRARLSFAKEADIDEFAATLDQFSHGRMIFGVGVGAYREEFKATYPRRKGQNRGAIHEEGLEALSRLLRDRRASFEGRYLQYNDVELYPKPAVEGEMPPLRDDQRPVYQLLREAEDALNTDRRLAASFADYRESFDQELLQGFIQCVGAFLFDLFPAIGIRLGLIGNLVETLLNAVAELVGFGAQLLVRKLLHLGFERTHILDLRHHTLDVALVLGAKDLGGNCLNQF